MDLLFLEELEFKVEHTVFLRARVAPSREEVLRLLMENVGIELVDYHSFTVQPYMGAHHGFDLVKAYSQAFRERTERAAAYR